MPMSKNLWPNRKLFYGKRRPKIPKSAQPSNKLKVRAFLDFILSKWKSKDLKLIPFIKKLNKSFKIPLNLLKSQYVLPRKLKKWLRKWKKSNLIKKKRKLKKKKDLTKKILEKMFGMLVQLASLLSLSQLKTQLRASLLKRSYSKAD